jgi:hypothetical protein
MSGLDRQSDFFGLDRDSTVKQILTVEKAGQKFATNEIGESSVGKENLQTHANAELTHFMTLRGLAKFPNKKMNNGKQDS